MPVPVADTHWAGSVPRNYGLAAVLDGIVAGMVRIQISLELEEDEYGPRVTYLERFVLPPWFAQDATEAHAKLLTLLVTARYVELRVGPKNLEARGYAEVQFKLDVTMRSCDPLEISPRQLARVEEIAESSQSG